MVANGDKFYWCIGSCTYGPYEYVAAEPEDEVEVEFTPEFGVE